MRFVIDFNFSIRRAKSDWDRYAPIKECPFCHCLFNYQDYLRVHKELQKNTGLSGWGAVKHCSLYCAWLRCPSMVSTIRRMDGDKKLKEMIKYIEKKSGRPIHIVL